MDLDRCNLCRLEEVRRTAEARGEIATIVSGPLGTGVHVHPKGVEPTPTRESLVAWYIEVPESCCCGAGIQLETVDVLEELRRTDVVE